MSIRRPLDLERAMLDRAIGEEVELVVERKGQPLTLSLLVAKRSSNRPSIDSRNWNILGMQLATAEARDVQRQSTRYRGGLSVVSVREDGPAKKQGIRPGDILVGMHVWETISLDNVEYILNRPDFEQITPVKFYVIRDGVTLIGRMPLDGSVK
jgi:serine protease Do